MDVIEDPELQEKPYEVRWIRFLGARRPVLMQNDNGPCPLLALYNCLSLLGIAQVAMPNEKIRYCYTNWCAEKVQAHIQHYNRSHMHDSNLRMLVQEAIELIPSLRSGLDINVRFGRGSPSTAAVESFTFTPQIAIFDFCGLRLCHGWVPDARTHPEAAKALSSLSYDQLVDLLVSAGSPAPAGARAGAGALPGTPVRAQSGGAAGSATPGAAALQHRLSTGIRTPMLSAAESSLGGEEGGAAAPAGVAAAGDAAAESLGDAEESLGSRVAGGAAAGGAAAAVAGDAAHRPVASSFDLSSSSETAAASSAAAPAPAPPAFSSAAIASMQRWLADTSHQLTSAGLEGILGVMQERELAVFFRNNHFSTVFKYKGRLYSLVTDLGFTDIPEVVWERLDDVRGNTTFVDCDFKAQLQSHVQLENTGSSLQQQALLEEEERQLAEALAASMSDQQEHGQQGQGQGRGKAAAAASRSSGGGGGGGAGAHPVPLPASTSRSHAHGPEGSSGATQVALPQPSKSSSSASAGAGPVTSASSAAAKGGATQVALPQPGRSAHAPSAAAVSNSNAARPSSLAAADTSHGLTDAELAFRLQQQEMEAARREEEGEEQVEAAVNNKKKDGCSIQ